MVAPNPFDLPRHAAESTRDLRDARRHDARGSSRLGRWLRLAALPAVLSLLLSLLLPVAIATAQDDDDDEDDGEPPAGDYTVAITEDDIPSDLVNGPDLIGRWQIFFLADGTYTLRRADVGEVVTGSYSIEDETIAITDEAGLLSCVNAAPTGGAGVGTETGTYAWDFDDDDGLILTPIEEGCAGRALILSTRPLDFFVACTTEAISIPPPTGDAEDEDEAAEDDDDDGGLDDPFGGDDDDDADEDDGDEDVEVDEDEADDGIDAVLGQLTACWATQDPARILPLFGSGFLDALTADAGSLYDVAGIFGQIMAIPITWERAGEIDIEGANASALVSQTIGAEESFVRFQFVFEDGIWKLASFG